MENNIFDKKNNNKNECHFMIIRIIEFYNKLNYTYLAENKDKTKR